MTQGARAFPCLLSEPQEGLASPGDIGGLSQALVSGDLWLSTCSSAPLGLGVPASLQATPRPPVPSAPPDFGKLLQRKTDFPQSKEAYFIFNVFNSFLSQDPSHD